MLVVDALPPARAGLGDLMLERCAVRATLIDARGRPEELLLSDASRHLRLTIRSGSVRSGHIRLRFVVNGLAHLDRQMETLRSVASLASRGRIADRERRSPAKKLIPLLRVHDAAAAGASQRDIAAGMIGEHWLADGWRGPSDFLRSRVRRMIRAAREMVDGGYRTLLR